MLSLKGRQDGFRLTLPKDFIPKNIEEKYSHILNKKRSFIIKPIDFLNETIQSVEVLGFQNASVLQSQQVKGNPNIGYSRYKENIFPYPASEVAYRSPQSAISLIDKTLNITFKHTLGYLNYFILFESFLYYYQRDVNSQELPKYIDIDLMDENGSIYSKIVIYAPVIDGIEMLTLDSTKPIAASSTFRLIIKYSNLDYQFIEEETSNHNEEIG